MIPVAILTLFAQLDAAHVRYVVLRGYLPLDELAESQDIDVYIARRDRRRAAAVLARAGWLERRHQTGRYPHRFYDNFEVPGRVCTMLDVVYGLYYGDRLHGLTGCDRVLDTAEALGEGRVPHPWVALLTFALHVVLDKQALSEQNARRGRLLWQSCQNRPDGAALVEREFGTAALGFAERFGRSVAGTQAATVEELRREALTLQRLRPRPTLARVHGLWVRLRQRMMQPLRVAVIGMDGAGKTTLVEYAVSLAGPLPMGSAYLGHNQYLTRVFRWVLARMEVLQARGDGDSVELKLLDKVRALWWPLELYARMRRAERARAIVVYDRYPFPQYERDDQPTSVPGHVMAAYERLWTTLLPKPHLLLFLDGDPEVLWSRKREYPFEAFQQGRARYLRLMDQLAGERRVVPTDGPLSASKASMIEALRTSTALRRRLYRQRFAGNVART